jgi:hypothetical protein
MFDPNVSWDSLVCGGSNDSSSLLELFPIDLRLEIVVLFAFKLAIILFLDVSALFPQTFSGVDRFSLPLVE